MPAGLAPSLGIQFWLTGIQEDQDTLKAHSHGLEVNLHNWSYCPYNHLWRSQTPSVSPQKILMIFRADKSYSNWPPCQLCSSKPFCFCTQFPLFFVLFSSHIPFKHPNADQVICFTLKISNLWCRVSRTRLACYIAFATYMKCGLIYEWCIWFMNTVSYT